MTKKRNPQDSTLRNVRAAKKDFEYCKHWIRKLAIVCADLHKRMKRIEKKFND